MSSDDGGSRQNPEIGDTSVYAAPRDQQNAPRALYVHVPFCLHRCGYCDFTLVAERDDLIPAYLEALRNEFSQLDRRYEVDTVFVGGGTPTHLSPAELRELFEIVHSHFDISENAEVSVEANPDGLDKDRRRTLLDCGVSRLSLGVQSFDDDVLKTLERQHRAVEAQAVIEAAACEFRSVSLDLIFAVPGQSIESWSRTLDTAVNLSVDHISSYGLTYEKGTNFFSRRRRGTLQTLPEETERSMYAMAMERLPQHGYSQYEISNFAMTGRECCHNMTYWSADEYFAFGPGAARYVNGERSTNSRNVNRWITSWLRGDVALQDRETLSKDDRAREAAFLGLRRMEGIRIADFERRFGVSPCELNRDGVRENIDRNWLEVSDGFLRLTLEGRFMADSVVVCFL